MSYHKLDWKLGWNRYSGRPRVPAFTIQWKGITTFLPNPFKDKLVHHFINMSDNFRPFYDKNHDQIREFDLENDVDSFGDITIEITSEQQARNICFEEPVFDSNGRCIVLGCMIVLTGETWMLPASFMGDLWGNESTEHFLFYNGPEVRMDDPAIDGRRHNTSALGDGAVEDLKRGHQEKLVFDSVIYSDENHMHFASSRSYLTPTASAQSPHTR